jgi:hypothetical protein
MKITILLIDENYKDSMAIHLNKEDGEEYKIEDINESYISKEKAEEIIKKGENIEENLIEEISENLIEEILQFQKIKQLNLNPGTRYVFYDYIKSENGIVLLEDADGKDKLKYANNLNNAIKEEIEYSKKELLEKEKQVNEIKEALQANFEQRERYSKNKNLIFDIKIYSVDTTDEFMEENTEEEREYIFNQYTEEAFKKMINEIEETVSIDIDDIYQEGRMGGWLVIKSGDIPHLEQVEEKEELITERLSDIETLQDNIDLELSYEEEDFVDDLIKDIERFYKDYNSEELDEEINIEEIEEIIEKHKELYSNSFAKYYENF